MNERIKVNAEEEQRIRKLVLLKHLLGEGLFSNVVVRILAAF